MATARSLPVRVPVRALAVIPPERTAVGYARFFLPFEHLADRGFRLKTLGPTVDLTRIPGGLAPHPRLLEDVDLLLFPQAVAEPTLPDGARVRIVEPLCHQAQRRGIPVVYVVDDLVGAVEDHNPGAITLRAAAENHEVILERADAIIATTETLAAEFRGSGKPVHVIPNAVDPSRWRSRPRLGNALRVGWAGSSSHSRDLLLVLPALARVERRIPITFIVLGLVDRPLDQQAEEIRRNGGRYSEVERRIAATFLTTYRALGAVRHRHVPFVPLEEYFTALPALDFDLGLCPLEDTRFNRGKSALKFYEYAVSGTATLASDVPPYRGEVSLTVSNTEDAWAEAIEALLADPHLREREIEAQRSWVLAERSITTVRDLWARAFEQILSRGMQAAAVGAPTCGPMTRI